MHAQVNIIKNDYFFGKINYQINDSITYKFIYVIFCIYIIYFILDNIILLRQYI